MDSEMRGRIQQTSAEIAAKYRWICSAPRSRKSPTP